jgi:NAD(P)-dependent dehydrogenase (short-subunit alcohol dehydrogenase family)
MNITYDFKGQVALVTGGSSGIGLATGKALGEAGAAVVLADINATAVVAGAAALSSAGHQVIGISCDVADEAQVASMVDHTVATFGRLDEVLHSAGDILNRHFGIHTMLVEKIDAIGPETLERALHRRFHPFWTAVEAAL